MTFYKFRHFFYNKHFNNHNYMEINSLNKKIPEKINLNNESFHIHRGNDFFKIALKIVLVLLLILTFYGLQHLLFLMFATSLSIVFVILCIRYDRIKLYPDRFEISKKSFISKFSDIHTFYYKDLLSIQYSKGKVNWEKVKTYTLFGFEPYGGKDFYARPDQLIIVTKSNEEFVFLKFGNEASFIKTIQLIKTKLV